ncbi:hypothetical protein T261_6819 [Streptomyces lydicus]|nr:hypothetical protein T261_6819 [Streptomyces lydicus]
MCATGCVPGPWPPQPAYGGREFTIAAHTAVRALRRHRLASYPRDRCRPKRAAWGRAAEGGRGRRREDYGDRG